MRRILSLVFIVVFAAVAAVSGAKPVPAAPPPARTLTGLLANRDFFRDCRCYTWIISKNNKDSEMDVSAVQDDARAMMGTRVRATGTWSTYTRDGRRVPYMIVTRLDPA